MGECYLFRSRFTHTAHGQGNLLQNVAIDYSVIVIFVVVDVVVIIIIIIIVIIIIIQIRSPALPRILNVD